MESGAGKESRTPDLNLGKVALYQLSYSRACERRNYKAIPGCGSTRGGGMRQSLAQVVHHRNDGEYGGNVY
jgi:hypothetical protein